MFKAIARYLDPTFGGVATLVAASLTALGMAYIVPGGVAAPAHTGSVAETVERVAPVWQITDDMSGASCEARPGPRISNGVHSVDLSESCASLMPALADAAAWKVDLEGAITIKDSSGRLIVAFAPADGRQLEAIEPEQIMMSMHRM